MSPLVAYKPQPIAEVASRIRAARAYGGFGNWPDLSAAAKLRAPRRRGLGPDNIERISRAENANEVDESLLGPIAEACGLPVEFFYADFSPEALRKLTQPDPRAQVVAKLGEAAQQLHQPDDDTGEDRRDRSAGDPRR